jgi:hypothetical protein
MGRPGPILFVGYRRFVLPRRVGGSEMTTSDPPGATSPAPERRFAGAGANRCGDAHDPLMIDRRRLARVSSIGVALLLPLLLLACKVVETDEQGWHLTTAGIWLLALAVGLPAVIATQRGFLNPRCREPKRRGWFGFEIGGGDGDGGCSGGWSD